MVIPLLVILSVLQKLLRLMSTGGLLQDFEYFAGDLQHLDVGAPVHLVLLGSLDSVGLHCSIMTIHYSTQLPAGFQVAQWIRAWTGKREVPGSNPASIRIFFFFTLPQLWYKYGIRT